MATLIRKERFYGYEFSEEEQLSNDLDTYKSSAMEAIKISNAEKNGKMVTICCKSDDEKEKLSNFIETININNISCIVTNDAVNEYLNFNKENNFIKYGKFYKICKTDQIMKNCIETIQKGIVPLITTIPTQNDDFISAIFEMYDNIIGRDLINKLYADIENSKRN